MEENENVGMYRYKGWWIYVPHLSLAVCRIQSRSVVAWLHSLSPSAGKGPQRRVRDGSEFEAAWETIRDRD